MRRPTRPAPLPFARPLARALAAACALSALAACRHEPEATGAIATADYRARHPIALAEGERSLDVFPTGPGHLDPRQAADVDAFLLEYRRYGRGGVLVDAPQGLPPPAAASVARTLDALRRRAAEDGLPPGEVVAAGYPVAAPTLAAPIRLTFRRLQAKVADACGLWPQDTGASDFAADFSNRPTWNFGCATQATLAAQVADPVDLVRGRVEGRIDTVRRVRDIGLLREGKDPSTLWRQDGQTAVKAQVAN